MKPSAELLVATGCHHCPIVMNELSELLKTGEVSSLTISNIAIDNTRAEALKVRSVPWFSLHNKFSFMIFTGEHSPKEIKEWVKVAQTERGMRKYIEDFLTNGQLLTITQAIQLHPDMFSSVIEMIKDEETSMNIRIGLDALIENFANTETLNKHSTELKYIADAKNIRLQIDALHYIALTGNEKNRSFLSEKTKHKDAQIKEAAKDALETLNDILE